jgi:hypothetical protein
MFTFALAVRKDGSDIDTTGSDLKKVIEEHEKQGYVYIDTKTEKNVMVDEQEYILLMVRFRRPE